jgi:hypothetical protein
MADVVPLPFAQSHPRRWCHGCAACRHNGRYIASAPASATPHGW